MHSWLGILFILLGSACGDSDPANTDATVSDSVSSDMAPASDVPDVANPPTSNRLVWIGPHPDDEFYAAPMLGHYCRDLGWECLMVVLTRGEGGACGLSEGCNPDLGSVRALELEAAARVLGSELDAWDLGDNGKFEPFAGDVEEVLQLWSNRAGGAEALVGRVVDRIQAHNATLVVSIDPRHGNYYHPSHRAAGALAVQAIRQLGDAAPELQMVASRGAGREEGWGFLPVVPSDPTLTYFDGTTFSESIGAESHEYFLQVLMAHPSQYELTDELLAELRAVGPERKRISLVHLNDAMEDDPLYKNLCAPSTF